MNLYDEKTLKRFWAKVDRKGPDECWPWIGTLCNYGYGQFNVNKTKKRAHRFSLEIHKGAHPAGKPMALHLCDFPGCCNPAHLRWGTNVENVADALKNGRIHNRITPETVSKIKADIRAGVLTFAAIAKKYGASHSTVRDIKSGARWGSVETYGANTTSIPANVDAVLKYLAHQHPTQMATVTNYINGLQTASLEGSAPQSGVVELPTELDFDEEAVDEARFTLQGYMGPKAPDIMARCVLRWNAGIAKLSKATPSPDGAKPSEGGGGRSALTPEVCRAITEVVALLPFNQTTAAAAKRLEAALAEQPKGGV